MLQHSLSACREAAMEVASRSTPVKELEAIAERVVERVTTKILARDKQNAEAVATANAKSKEETED